MLLRSSSIAQIGTPQEIYERPANGFVADFIGDTNFIDCVAEVAVGNELAVSFSNGMRWQLPHWGATVFAPKSEASEVLRPYLVMIDTPGSDRISGQITGKLTTAAIGTTPFVLLAIGLFRSMRKPSFPEPRV